MKRCNLVITLLVMSIIVIMLCTALTINNIIQAKRIPTNLYPMTAKVFQIDRERDVATVTNFAGESFEFRGVEDFEIGDVVSLIMDDNGTPNIRDDKIVDIKYSGASKIA